MHRHKNDDRYDHRRDDDRRDDRDRYKSGRRNRWDDMDDSRSRSGDRRGREETKSTSRWDRDSRGSRLSPDYPRSRERSRSPFSGRDGGNPSRDEYTHNQSTSRTQESGNDLAKKSNNWSDSSDEEFSSRRNSRLDSVRDLEQVPTSSSNTGKPIPDEGIGKMSAGISLKLGGSVKAQAAPLPKVISVPVTKKPTKISAIFNTDDDDEEEEMPPECKMRMKNVGRETKTSEGPNSFGKTKIGFCNMSHLAEKELEGNPKNKRPQ